MESILKGAGKTSKKSASASKGEFSIDDLSAMFQKSTRIPPRESGRVNKGKPGPTIIIGQPSTSVKSHAKKEITLETQIEKLEEDIDILINRPSKLTKTQKVAHLQTLGEQLLAKQTQLVEELDARLEAEKLNGQRYIEYLNKEMEKMKALPDIMEEQAGGKPKRRGRKPKPQ